MRTRLQRLWDYLRRCIVGDDEGVTQDGEGRPPPTRAIGEELQDFFLLLFQDENLRRFQQGDREDYVAQYIAEYPARRGRDLSDDAKRLIRSPDLREIEGHIAQIQSTPARLLYVVCPPM
jgi:hypothetical protein